LWPMLIVIVVMAVIVSAAIIVAVSRPERPAALRSPDPPAAHVSLPPGTLPHKPGTYLGVYAARGSLSYAGVAAFTRATGVTPDVVTYYSAWYERFQAGFAKAAAKHGAVPLIQIQPADVSLTAIAAGKYDDYLSDYAAAVRSYRHPVILSFGHEMNGSWYSWGHRQASPAAFVAAWRHIVTLFRAVGTRNVTWMWTVNVIDTRHDRIPAPASWWPGRKYVNWVGIDGYYYKSSWTFAPLFGPTIAKVRELTRDPILISETGVAPAAGQPAKIANLYAGVHAYGLLGFVWFDAHGNRNWRIKTRAAAAALFQGSKAYRLPAL
jgi:mannan endo-1,4-beta-mannosidase